MLKLFLVCLILCRLTLAEDMSKINYLINEDLFGNATKIQEASNSLLDEQKLKLFEMQKQSPTAPLLINMLLLPGVGSLIQKDFKGAAIGFGTYTAGWGILLTAAYYPKPKDGNDVAWHDYNSERRILAIIGGTGLAAGWLYSIIRPAVYSKNYNKMLGQALNLASNISFDQNNNCISYNYKF